VRLGPGGVSEKLASDIEGNLSETTTLPRVG
jgi:hypothetical protein